MNIPAKNITAEDIIAYINATDINTLKAMRILIDAKVGGNTTTTASTKSDFRTGDRVYFENKRSRKLPIGKNFGTIEKVNITRAKVRVETYIDVAGKPFATTALWTIPFDMLHKA